MTVYIAQSIPPQGFLLGALKWIDTYNKDTSSLGNPVSQMTNGGYGCEWQNRPVWRPCRISIYYPNGRK